MVENCMFMECATLQQQIQYGEAWWETSLHVKNNNLNDVQALRRCL